MPTTLRNGKGNERNGKKLITALCIDDGLIAANHERQCEILIEKLKSIFKILTSNFSYFLGLKIEFQKNGDIKNSSRVFFS